MSTASLIFRRLGLQAPPVSRAARQNICAGLRQSGPAVRLLSPTRLDYREKIWDQAAGALILEEAGGKITDLDGKPLDFAAGRTLANNRGVLASNGFLHSAALNGLHAVHA
jgi:3'(2'), 5'-bisphosphate nucleotidase